MASWSVDGLSAPAPRAAPGARTRPRQASSSATEDGERLLRTSLQEARRGNAAGFEAVYRALTPRLTRYARGLVGQDADDVVGEAWLQIVRDLAGFDGDWDAFRAWTTRIVRNRAIDHRRAAARHNARTGHLDEATERPGQLTTEDAAEESMSTAAALQLVATLPPDQAEAVLLRVVVGLDARSAGAVVGKRSGAIRVAAHRGLKTLARRLEAAASQRNVDPDPGKGGR